MFPHLITVSHYKGEIVSDIKGVQTVYEKFDYIGKAKEVIHRQVDDHLLFTRMPTLEDQFNTGVNITSNNSINLHLGHRMNEGLKDIKSTKALEEYFVTMLKERVGI
jgi:hypothetical protein